MPTKKNCLPTYLRQILGREGGYCLDEMGPDLGQVGKVCTVLRMQCRVPCREDATLG